MRTSSAGSRPESNTRSATRRSASSPSRGRSGRASKLAEAGLTDPADVRRAGVDGLVDAGLSEGVAERVLEQAAALPDLSVEWTDVPDSIAAGENTMAEVTVRNGGEGTPAGLRLTVNGIEMSETTRYLGETAIPVGVFGGDTAELTYRLGGQLSRTPVAPRHRQPRRRRRVTSAVAGDTARYPSGSGRDTTPPDRLQHETATGTVRDR